MSRVFVDTSAIYAVLDSGDHRHGEAAKVWRELLLSEVTLLTSNYILVECCALLQNRLGLEAVQVFTDDIVPLMDVRWIDAGLHRGAESVYRSQRRRSLSLVDCSSFQVIRQSGVSRAFTLDRHFAEQGFECLPDVKVA